MDVMMSRIANKTNDLLRFKPEIRELLEEEIASRYYFEKGRTEASFDDDPNVQAAIAVLNEPNRYAALLKPGGQAASAKKAPEMIQAGGK